MKILVVHKKSNLEVYGKNARLEKSPRGLAELQGGHDAHTRTLKAVERALAPHDVRWMARERMQEFNERDFDFALTVGGDGTLLTLSPFLHDLPVLAVNSAPRVSVGYFAAANAKSVGDWVKRIVQGKAQPRHVARLATFCDDKRIGPPALNDVLFSHPAPAATTRLLIKTPGAKRWETQKNSGVWIATAAGSHGALGSAGGKRVALTRPELQYFVREPYQERERYQQLRGFIRTGEVLRLESRMPAALLSFDGWAEVVSIPFGGHLRFEHYPHPLQLF